ncbi:hypothetical protein Tco_1383586 [Tanacetum coccineum]
MVDRGNNFDSGFSVHNDRKQGSTRGILKNSMGDLITFGGISEETNSAGSSQTPESIASEDKDEEVELIVVPSAVKIPKEKDESRTSSTNSKTEETLTEPQKEMKDFSIDPLEDNPKIQAFRREVDHDDSIMPELEIFYKPETGIFDEASYDEEGVITDFNSLPTEIEVYKSSRTREESSYLKDKESPFDLEAFSDSDYGGSNLDRKSITGGYQFLGQRLISWQCKKQTIVATSTIEA